MSNHDADERYCKKHGYYDDWNTEGCRKCKKIESAQGTDSVSISDAVSAVSPSPVADSPVVPASIAQAMALEIASLRRDLVAAEAENVALLALLERCRPVLVKVFNVRLSEVKDTLPTPLQEAASKLIGEIDAAKRLEGK